MKVVITVDTEPSIAGFFQNPKFTPLIHQPISGNINGKSEALGFFINLMKQYNFVATFFVETVHSCYFSPDIMQHYVSELLKANQDVQLHLHPVWRYFRDKEFVSDNCSDHSVEFMLELLEEGKSSIKNWTGNKPVALRTGNFSAGDNVYKAMGIANLKISSNICMGSVDYNDPELLVTHGIHNIYGITELPVSCFYDKNIIKWNNLRSLQITALGGYEIPSILDKMEKSGHQVAVIVTHPFEFLKTKDFRYTNMRINKMVQSRAEYLCNFLSNNRNRFQVVPIAEAAKITDVHPDNPVSGNPIVSLWRSVENFINDRI
jgi:hypothetical protein